MEEKKDFIADIDLKLICDFFTPLDRQGPGSVAETKKALSFIGELPLNAKIADIGCGTGGQTITLAENTFGKIIAVDMIPDMIKFLNDRVNRHGFESRISGLVASMDNLPFSENEFDLIWAEGSIYNIGFEKGINNWKKYLKLGGYIAVTDVAWILNNPPDEIEKYWANCYPEINTNSVKIRQMEQAGYIPVASFVLPESCWLDNYYKPISDRFETFLDQHNNSESAQQLINYLKEEIDYYNKYKEYYSYIFYIGKKQE